MAARYRALRKLYLDRLIPEGATFTWDGPPGRGMEPLNEEAIARFKAAFAGKEFPATPAERLSREQQSADRVVGSTVKKPEGAPKAEIEALEKAKGAETERADKAEAELADMKKRLADLESMLAKGAKVADVDGDGPNHDGDDESEGEGEGEVTDEGGDNAKPVEKEDAAAKAKADSLAKARAARAAKKKAEGK